MKFTKRLIIDDSGKKNPVHYSLGGLRNYPEGTITIYSKSWAPFSKGVQESFKVENNSDILTDYHEHEKIRVVPTNKFYDLILPFAQ